MDEELQQREEEIKAVDSKIFCLFKDFLVFFQARENLSVEKLKEYKDIFSFFDKYDKFIKCKEIIKILSEMMGEALLL